MDIASRIVWRSVIALLCTALALPAFAQAVRIEGVPRSPPQQNDFADRLPRLLMQDVSLLLTERSRLVFTEVAAESGNANSLTVAGLGALSENRDFGFVSRRLFSGNRQQMQGIFPAGSLDPLLAFSSDLGDPARPGNSNFGVFADGVPGGDFTTFYIVYDDTLGDDSDFDDYIIRVDVEPVN